jgi:hypothetical protein
MSKRLRGGSLVALLVLSLVLQVLVLRVQAAGFCGAPNAAGGMGSCVSESGGAIDANFSPATVSIAPVNFGEFDINAEGAPALAVTGTAVVTVNDLTGANQGWTVNLYATDFDAPGAPTQISASNIYISGNPVIVTTNSVDQTTCTSDIVASPPGNICSGTSPLGSVLPVGNRRIVGNASASLKSPGQVIAYACPYTGGGQSDITVPLTLIVPSEVLPGSYTNSFIAQLYKGPAINNTVCSTLLLGRAGPATPIDATTGAPYDPGPVPSPLFPPAGISQFH